MAHEERLSLPFSLRTIHSFIARYLLERFNNKQEEMLPHWSKFGLHPPNRNRKYKFGSSN